MRITQGKHALKQGLLAGLLVILAAGKADADPFLEYPDAGQLPGTAQNTGHVSGDALSAIRGTLGGTFGGDGADLYRIQLTAGTAFSATTTASSYQFNAFDTMLFLFDASGHGLVANDDDPSVGPQSSISFNATYTGLYYLGISGSGFVPTDGNGDLFPGLLFSSDQHAAGAGTLGGWSGTTSEGDAYEILLDGAMTVPEPQTLLLVGLALVGVAASRRRH